MSKFCEAVCGNLGKVNAEACKACYHADDKQTEVKLGKVEHKKGFFTPVLIIGRNKSRLYVEDEKGQVFLTHETKVKKEK